MIVIDASLAAAIVLQDEADPPQGVLERIYAGPLIAPALWITEIGNALLLATRRKRLDDESRRLAIRDLRALTVTIVGTTPDDAWTHSFELAERFGLTLYDAVYLQLAISQCAVLASNDADLIEAARACGVELLTSLS